MIDRETMFEPLLEAQPGIRGLWEALVAEWPDLPASERPNYMLLGDIAIECSKMLADGRESDVAAVFAVAERWIVEGDEYVKNAAIVGFLEDAQNENLHRGTKPADFIRFLGPESLFWWKKVDGFWNRRELIVDDRPPRR